MSARWVFDLFNQQRLHPFYKSPVQNKLTQSYYRLAPYEAEYRRRGNLFKIADIPGYLAAELYILPGFATKSVRQYKGFLLDLSNYKTVEEYLLNRLSGRSRRRLRNKKRALNHNHSVRLEVFYGAIGEQQHDELMHFFKDFLKKRFDAKKTYNNYLDKWDYYHKLSFEKINMGLASLFVLYDAQKPICITLNFHYEDVIFSELEGFDMAFSQYGLGDISMLNHLEWCLQNDVKIIDLSMGETNFKNKWCNHSYNFDCHLHYEKNNVVSQVTMLIHWSKLSLMQFLRDIGLVGRILKYDRLKFLLKAH